MSVVFVAEPPEGHGEDEPDEAPAERAAASDVVAAVPDAPAPVAEPDHDEPRSVRSSEEELKAD